MLTRYTSLGLYIIFHMSNSHTPVNKGLDKMANNLQTFSNKFIGNFFYLKFVHKEPIYKPLVQVMAHLVDLSINQYQ